MVRVLLLEWRSNEFWQPFPPTSIERCAPCGAKQLHLKIVGQRIENLKFDERRGGGKRGRRIQLFDNGKLNNTEGKNAVSFLLEGGLNIREKIRNVKLSRKATREESLKGFGHWVKIVLRIFHVPTSRRLGKNSNNSDEIFPSTCG